MNDFFSQLLKLHFIKKTLAGCKIVHFFTHSDEMAGAVYQALSTQRRLAYFDAEFGIADSAMRDHGFLSTVFDSVRSSIHGHSDTKSDLYPVIQVLFIDNAEDFDSLRRLKGFSDLWTSIEVDSGKKGISWIFRWQTPRFSEWIKGSSPEGIPLTNDNIPVAYINHHRADLSRGLCERLVKASGSDLDYIALLCSELPYNADLEEVDAYIRGTLYAGDSKLNALCRRRWSRILNRARGYSSLKSILLTLAFNPFLRLVDIAEKTGSTMPATKDYINSLLEVGAIVLREKRYQLSDPVLENWIRIRSESAVKYWVDGEKSNVGNDFIETD